jgi:hypothetical protein
MAGVCSGRIAAIRKNTVVAGQVRELVKKERGGTDTGKKLPYSATIVAIESKLPLFYFL